MKGNLTDNSQLQHETGEVGSAVLPVFLAYFVRAVTLPKVAT